jgi:hypothetical protein
MEARLAQVEQQGLKIGVKTKHLSLAASIREWSGRLRAKSVKEFLTQIEQCAPISNWNKDDVVNILKDKLTGEAVQFGNGRDKFTDENVKYKTLKAGPWIALVRNCYMKPRKGRTNHLFNF